ncbi:hypothetical protein BJX66DRAFT_335851 [Aspergillus keveii]|uniref:F-box domain protein n=1 Tax=Aspergillus keveii TaxID=714993 RepID=A0ABR4GC60_9EURO
MYGRRMPAHPFEETIIPVCYICSEYIQEPGTPYMGCTPRYVKKAYDNQQPADQQRNRRNWEWYRYYRAILLHPEQDICQLSGTSYWYLTDREDSESSFLKVPWDEKATSGLPGKVKPSTLMAKAFLLQVGAEAPRDQLSGVAVHYRCWELLCTHPIWTISRKDITAVLRALQRKSEKDWGFLYSWDDSEAEYIHPGTDSSSDSDLSMDDPPMHWEYSDPFYNKRAQGLIQKAKRAKDEQLPERIMTRLDGLPLEILWMTLDLLSTQDVIALENGVGRDMGDVYWRSRTNPKLFHELRYFSESEEQLNWRFLSIELEKLTFNRKHEFYGRRWVLKRLDQLLDLLPSSDDESSESESESEIYDKLKMPPTFYDDSSESYGEPDNSSSSGDNLSETSDEPYSPSSIGED